MSSRRSLLQSAAIAATAQSMATRLDAASQAAPMKGNIQHSVCKWCYPKISLEDLCKAAKGIGLSSIELLGPDDWPTLAKHGLTCAIATAPNIDGLGGITKSFNRIEHHDKLVQVYSDWIPKAAAAGVQNLICFSGNRDGLDDQKGLENCAIGLKRLMPLVEKHKVNLVMELLNSKVNHKDYQCDHTAWGVELCKQVGSERMRLLYDIYHMQIMEGDVIANIRQYHPYFAHYHTGGVPGRNEIDESQELYYPAIVKAIVATGFKGFIAQEFIPKRTDALASLKQGVSICDV
ncbi:MAG: TIM barrel protein [Acidobacteria bacterium]|nr:TIM barrel protein [Acidobacteriota bacterium]